MTDKFKHIIWGAAIAFIIGVPVYASSHDLFAGLWAALAGLVAGGVKEWCDNRTEFNKWNWVDLGFTAIGVGVTMLFILCLHVGKG